jgi:hypothetical protein
MTPLEVASGVLQVVLRDEAWQDLGFAGRPRYGSFIQRFRPEWRVRLEKSILKQMIAVLAAAHVSAGVLRQQQLPEMVRLLVDGPGGTPALWPALGYTSRAEADQDLTASTNSYARGNPSNWGAELNERLDPSSVPNAKLAGRLFLGIARFSLTVQDMIAVLKAQNAG